MRILHAYILKELLKALALAVPTITGVFCFALVLQALQSRGLGPVASLRFTMLSAPGALYIALPLSAALVVTLIYGRMAADNEIMACRASGIPILSLVWPALLLAIFGAGLTLSLAAWPLPESAYAAKRVTLEYAEQLFFSQLENGRISVRDSGFQMTVDRVAGNRLYGMTLLQRGQGGQVTYIYAPVGKVEFDDASRRITLTMRDSLGEIVRPETPRPAATATAAPAAPAKGKSPPAAKAKVATAAPTTPTGFSSSPIQGDHVLAFDLPDYIPRRSDDLNLWQLMAVVHDPMLSDETRDWSDTLPPQTRQMALASIRARATASLHGRLATALGCLGLVLLGTGLGMRFSSGNLLTAFGLAILPWLFSYLMTHFVGVKTVAEHAADPDKLVWLIWLPNVLLLVLGVTAIAGVTWVWAHPVRLRHRIFGRRAVRSAAPAKS